MKFFSTIAVAATMVLSTQAVVVNLYSDQNCQNPAGQRNVYDNTCAPTGGFQSFSIDTYGGSLQKLIVWSRNACAGDQTNKVCAQGRNKPGLGACFRAYNGNGGSNALSSISSAADCPN